MNALLLAILATGQFGGGGVFPEGRMCMPYGGGTMSGDIDMGSNIITNIGNTGTDFVATTGALNLAGLLTAAGGVKATAAVGTCADGDVMVLDNNGLIGCVHTTDVAPQGYIIHPQDNFAEGAQTAADLVLRGGIDEKTVTIDDYTNCATDTVTLTLDGAANVCTENDSPSSVQWDAATDNATSATNLAVCLDAIAGVSASATAAVVYIVPGPLVESIALAEGDATCTTLSAGTDGGVIIPTTSSLGFGDGDTYISQATDGSIIITIEGTDRWTILSNKINGATGGVSVISRAVSNTVPGFITLKTDATTGLGGTTGTIWMTAAGAEIVEVDTTGVDIIGALTVTGDHTYYAEGYIDAGGQAVATTVQNTWVEIDGCTSGDLLGWTESACDFTAGASAGGTYEVCYSMSYGNAGAGAETYETGVSLGDTIQAGCRTERLLAAAGDVGVVAACCIMDIVATNVLKPEARGTDGTPQALDVSNLTFVIHKL
jgi:hypothetical protein